jgi:hypothetical protein
MPGGELVADSKDDSKDLTRLQFERAAELARRDDPYAVRWSRIHDAIATAVAKRRGRADG